MSTRARLALLALPTAFLAALFAFPVVAIVTTGLRDPSGGWALGRAVETITAPSTVRVVRYTLWQASLSTAAALLLGMPAAWLLGRVRFRGRGAFRVLVTLPFVLPTVVVAAAVLALAGPHGLAAGVVRLDDSTTGIVVAHAIFNVAVVARVVGARWSTLDRRAEDAARLLGASRWRAWRTVALPALAPALRSAAVLTFLFCATSYGVVVLLGSPEQATLETAIARAAITAQDRAPAAALAVLQLAVVATLLVLEGRARRRLPDGAASGAGSGVGAGAEGGGLRAAAGPHERALVAGAIAVTGAVVLLPLLVLLERSLRTTDGYGLAWYRALAGGSGSGSGGGGGGAGGARPGGPAPVVTDVAGAVRTSLGFAALATALACAIGLCAAVALAAGRDRLTSVTETLLALPIGASAVTVGLGFVVALDQPPLDLRDSALLVPLAHAVVAIPLVVRATVPAFRAVDPRLPAAAAVLGASRWRSWRGIDLALAAPSVLAAAGFAFAVSLGEFGATTVVARADRPTVTIAIGRLLGRPGDASFGQAAALSVLLVALTAAALAIAERGGRAALSAL